MWCSHCQQDVPAVARSPQGPLVCSQCEHEQLAVESPRPLDTGVPLASFDVGQVDGKQDLAPPIGSLESEQTRQKLRRIGRKLRTTSSPDFSVGSLPALQSECFEPQLRALSQQPVRHRDPRRAPAWAVSLLLVGGATAFCLGVGLLAWSAAFQLPKLWQWGMTATFAAEGTLILGLTWMAVRLWNHSRRVNRQLDGVDRQLNEIQELAGSLAGGQGSSSQHFYRHFSPTASPHMLVANLRGQVDQLASRLG